MKKLGGKITREAGPVKARRGSTGCRCRGAGPLSAPVWAREEPLSPRAACTPLTKLILSGGQHGHRLCRGSERVSRSRGAGAAKTRPSVSGRKGCQLRGGGDEVGAPPLPFECTPEPLPTPPGQVQVGVHPEGRDRRAALPGHAASRGSQPQHRVLSVVSVSVATCLGAAAAAADPHLTGMLQKMVSADIASFAPWGSSGF